MKTFGVERERFISDSGGKIVPAIGELLPHVYEVARKRGVSENLFSFELFAGQIEDRTPPCEDLRMIEDSLKINDEILLEAANDLGLSFDHSEFIDESKVISFEVNPFDRRHQEIWTSIPNERQIAASIVAAVHVHISVSNAEVVRVLNLCRKEIVDNLIQIGDHSNLRRINAYRTMAETDGISPTFSTFSEVIDYINSKGGEKSVWDVVRFKPSTGTVEFRMFGATPSIEEIIRYINACHDLISDI